MEDNNKKVKNKLKNKVEIKKLVFLILNTLIFFMTFYFLIVVFIIPEEIRQYFL